MELYKTSLVYDNDLVHYSRFYGVVIRDYAPGIVYQLSQVGTIALDASGKYNGCINATFNASNYLWSTSFYNFRNSNISIGAWIKIASPPSNNYTPTLCAIGQGNPRFYIVISKTTGYVNLYTWDGGALNTNGTFNVCDNAWHHICAVRSGTSHKMYVDGIENGSATGTAKDINTTYFYVGRSSDATYDLLGEAYIDDFFIFKRALTVGEISLLASNLDLPTINYYRRVRVPGLVSGSWTP